MYFLSDLNVKLSGVLSVTPKPPLRRQNEEEQRSTQFGDELVINVFVVMSKKSHLIKSV